MVDYGTDIKSDWGFHDGDLQLVSDKDNISQAIMNRLNTVQDSLDLFYDDYGSVLQSFLGWRKIDTTLAFMKVEIDSVLAKDPRINGFTSELEYTPEGNVRVDLSINSVGFSFVLSDDGTVMEA